MSVPDRRLCVAPMMDWTDRHCRVLHRLLAPRALLYTEMVTTGALLHGDAARHLDFDPGERPLALQLGGSEPGDLARCAALAARWGYDEVDLNCGCPSDRVQKGRFGACLMAEPSLVAECVAAMAGASPLPVTVKCRIGIDDSEELPFLLRFVERVAAAGCRTFIVHARKAWLKGLSPKENREVPPLRYPVVHALKAAHPELEIVLNGGLRDPARVAAEIGSLDGAMIGREAYQNPWSLRAFEAALFGAEPSSHAGASHAGAPHAGAAPTREAAVLAMAAYAERAMARGAPFMAVARPMLGLFNGLAGARAWRRHLSERGAEPGAGPQVLEGGLTLLAGRLREAA